MAPPPPHRLLSSPKAQAAAAAMLPPKPTKSSTDLPPAYPRAAKRALPGTRSGAKPRGKRVKQGDNRSTVTTTTDTARTPVNVYDAVLGEAEDLLQAAREAQALGRLKMASAYQLLLHARLVGLGKRFDRAQVIDPEPAEEEEPSAEGDIVEESCKAPTPKPAAEKKTPVKAQQPPPPVDGLSKYLPEDIQLDSQMMEHLARVAMELHHQKTGRKIQSDFASPVPTKSTVAWNEQEKHQCQILLDQGLSEHDIAQRMKTRSEQQVRAFLANQKQRAKEVRVIEQDFVAGEEDTPRKKGRGRKPPTQAMNTVPNANLDAKKLLSGKALG